MAIEKSQLVIWLNTIDDNAEIAIDVDGITLIEVGGEGRAPVGGDPEGIELSKTFSKGQYFVHNATLIKAEKDCTVTEFEFDDNEYTKVLDLLDCTPAEARKVTALFDADTTFMDDWLKN